MAVSPQGETKPLPPRHSAEMEVGRSAGKKNLIMNSINPGSKFEDLGTKFGLEKSTIELGTTRDADKEGVGAIKLSSDPKGHNTF